MKTLISTLLLTITFNVNAVTFDCYETGLKMVSEYLEYASPAAFLEENGEIFFCKSKKAPHTEILQWGDGSGLVGIEFEVRGGKCVVTEEPYTGQDDGDLDVEWAQEFCQDWE